MLYTNIYIISCIIAYSLFFSHQAQCMNAYPEISQEVIKHTRLLQAIRDNNWNQIISYIFHQQATESITVEEPEGEITYIERALELCKVENSEEELKKRKWMINQLIYYGFKLSAKKEVKKHIKTILPKRLALAILGKKEKLELALKEAKQRGEELNDAGQLNYLIAYAASQRQKSIVELLIAHGADPYMVTEHLDILKQLSIYPVRIKDEFKAMCQLAFEVTTL